MATWDRSHTSRWNSRIDTSRNKHKYVDISREDTILIRCHRREKISKGELEEVDQLFASNS